MATYLDVSSLVGIKISTTGSLSGSASYTVPSDSFAVISVICADTNQLGTSAMLPRVIAAGITIQSTNTNVTIAGRSFTLTSPTIQYVVFTNNQ